MLVHMALVVTQVCFGIGSVVGQVSLPSFNPLVFAAIREACAGPLLLLAALLTSKIDTKDLRPYALLGLTICGNQIFFILGLKLANAVAASIWQPTQPILTALLMFREEKLSPQQLLGIFLAFLGCSSMVFFSDKSERQESDSRLVAGHFCFFLNCL